MQVKRITAPNMRQALQIVREQLGPDAVILSNRRVPDGIELICSLEAPELVAAGPLSAEEIRTPASVKREPTTLEKGLTEWEQDSRARARAIELSLRQKLADKARTEKAKPGSAADIYEQRAASLANLQNAAAAHVAASIRQPAAARMPEKTAPQHAAPAQLKPEQPKSQQLKSQQLRQPAITRQPEIAHQQESTRQPVSGKTPAPIAAPVDLGKFTGAVASAVVSTAVSSPAKKPSAEPKYSATAVERNGRVEDVDALRNELQSLRTLLQGQFQHMAWMNLVQQEPARADVWKRLSRLGFDAECIQQLLDGVPVPDGAAAPDANRLWHEVLKQLLGKLPVAGGDMVAGGGVFAFVGPTGAGKTTTIGKLAARAVMQHGADNIVLVTTDTYRVAGHEQLRVFGRILGVKVIVVDNIEQLPAVIEQHARCHLVMVDTAGLSAKDERLQNQLSMLASLGSRIKTFVVMPCSLQAQTQKKAFDLYGAARPCGVVLTKLDEAATLGETLSLALRKSLPLCYVADGQQVPQDVHVASAREIVQRAVLSRSAQHPDDSEMAEAYWQVMQRSAAVDMQVA